MPPAPNPNARRGNASNRPPLVRLPGAGRKGAPPAWPLLTVPAGVDHAAELRLWAQLWTLPQAVAWERDRCFREVAMYTRQSLMAESGERYPASEARQLADRLGLNPKAMRMLVWQVDGDEVAEQREARTVGGQVASTDARQRFRAVDGGTA